MIALVERVVVGIVDVTRHRFQHADAKPAAEADEFGHRLRIAADIGGDDQRPSRLLDGVDEISAPPAPASGVGAIGGQSATSTATRWVASSITSRAPTR